MLTVSLQEVIERFMELLDLVESGESLTVVRDGLPVCEIVPSRSGVDQLQPGSS